MTHAISDTARLFLSAEKRHLIDGTWVSSNSKDQDTIIDPSTGEPLCTVPSGNAQDIDAAVMAARRAFDEKRWTGKTPAERAQIMWTIADLMLANLEELAELESLDGGKPINATTHGEIPAAAEAFRYYAGWCTKISGQTFTPSIPGLTLQGITQHEPVGVVGLIIPWNGPLVMAAWKLAPALAAGCSCVLKPAELTPLTALRLGELMIEAGMPAGVVNIVTGTGQQVGAHLAAHNDVNKIAFTGSTKVGKGLLNAAQDNLKKLSLELGGKSPVIIFDDANLDEAIPGAADAIFSNAGQVCVAGSRLLVQDTVYDDVLTGIKTVAENLSLGPCLDPNTDMGPLISDTQRNRVHNFVELSKKEGAQVIAGGDMYEGPGFYYQPTILGNITPDMTVYREEVFGPVLTVIPFTDFDDALTKANDSKYGLASSVWTQNHAQAHNMAYAIKAGIVWINCHGIPDVSMPIGGYKESGWGRELGQQGLSLYLEHKSIMMKL